MKGMHFKSMIAQRKLSDLGREWLVNIHHAGVYLQHFDIRSPSVADGEDALKVIRSAERVGFEPTVGQRPTTVFETAPFNHSGTSPFRGLIIAGFLFPGLILL
jgi:hypothetical protein